MTDIFTYLADMPCCIGGHCNCNPDGSYTILINAKYGYEEQKKVYLHDLRHTYATTLLANGFDYKTVAELMGDNVQTIIRTYSHFTKDMFDSAKTRIDNIL